MGFTATGDFRINIGAKRQIEEMSKKEQNKIGRRIRDIAKELVPIDTGELQTSIKSNRVGGDVVVSTSTGYGGYVELGTVKQSAQPFIMPAVQT
jgi:HK97 gp10 family phage protein